MSSPMVTVVAMGRPQSLAVVELALVDALVDDDDLAVVEALSGPAALRPVDSWDVNVDDELEDLLLDNELVDDTAAAGPVLAGSDRFACIHAIVTHQ